MPVADVCKKTVGVENTFIATDSKKIANKVFQNNFRHIMTSKHSLTGTDRFAEVARKIKEKISIFAG